MIDVFEVRRIECHRRSGRRVVSPASVLAVLTVLTAVAAACAPAAASPSATAAASVPPPSAQVSALASPASPGASARASQVASAVPSGACVDVADLADRGEPVVTAMTALKPALDAKKIDDARALVQTATKGMTSMADSVGEASPEAKQLFTKAATELSQAADQFPSGASLIDQAQHDLDQAFALAEAVRCAS